MKFFSGNIGLVDYSVFNAGSFYTDGGSSFGVLPKAVWQKSIPSDQRNRIELACNLMLIKDQDSLIIVDTGVGYTYDEKVEKIHSPESNKINDGLKTMGYTRYDVDIVVLTHLHHDHIGGIIYGERDDLQLMFPNADHYIQNIEWQIACNPDELNSAAYRYDLPLKVLKESGSIKLIQGDFKLTDSIKLMLVGGHSIGSQAVRIFNDNQLLYYPGDIIPQKYHLNLAVTSAYDISRQETVNSKKKILQELRSKGGFLVFNHQVDNIVYKLGA